MEKKKRNRAKTGQNQSKSGEKVKEKKKRGEMGILREDVVVISPAEKAGDSTVISVNCPDKTGLGCDLCRVILLFGLSIARAGKASFSLLFLFFFLFLEFSFCYLHGEL